MDDQSPGLQRAKTYSEIFSAVVLPFVLAGIGYYFTTKHDAREESIQQDQKVHELTVCVSTEDFLTLVEDKKDATRQHACQMPKRAKQHLGAATGAVDKRGDVDAAGADLGESVAVDKITTVLVEKACHPEDRAGEAR